MQLKELQGPRPKGYGGLFPKSLSLQTAGRVSECVSETLVFGFSLKKWPDRAFCELSFLRHRVLKFRPVEHATDDPVFVAVSVVVAVGGGAAAEGELLPHAGLPDPVLEMLEGLRILVSEHVFMRSVSVGYGGFPV
jgi:hypothetical protein